MSWQDYVDNQLLASQCVSKAAIAGHSGDLWAKSEGFEVNAQFHFHFRFQYFFYSRFFSSFATSRFGTVSFADFSETNHLLCSANGATQSARIEKRIENHSHREALAFFVHEIFPMVISNVGSSISMQ